MEKIVEILELIQNKLSLAWQLTFQLSFSYTLNLLAKRTFQMVSRGCLIKISVVTLMFQQIFLKNRSKPGNQHVSVNELNF